MSFVIEHLDSLVRLSPQSDTAVERESVAKLVERLRASDTAIHERCLRELLPDVRAWTASLAGSNPDFEDIVQDAMIEIATSLHRFEGRSSLRTLARRITVRTTIHFLRRARRRAATPLEEEPTCAIADPERETEERAILRKVRAYLDRLPTNRRVAFVLCAIEGLTPTEAAALVGCTALAMRLRLHQARSEMKRMLDLDPRVAAQLRDGT